MNNYLSTVGVVYAFVAKALAEVLTISGRQLTGKVLYRTITIFVRLPHFKAAGNWNVYVCGSVPNPDPPDPHVFEPSGSGSISQRYGSGSGSFYHQAKKIRKTLMSTVS